MVVPINKKDYEVFISESKIFKKTYDLMVKCLRSWYDDDKEKFINDMWTDFDTVMNTYRFENEGVSISKSYSYDPPLDYISCWIRIYDAEDTYCIEYTAFFDYELNCIDDKIC
ncbi:MAG: hypothetical protein E7208_11820 [Clostridium butyricum]|nr:hypothetical protein [Clostridium butyricum]